MIISQVLMKIVPQTWALPLPLYTKSPRLNASSTITNLMNGKGSMSWDGGKRRKKWLKHKKRLNKWRKSNGRVKPGSLEKSIWEKLCYHSVLGWQCSWLEDTIISDGSEKSQCILLLWNRGWTSWIHRAGTFWRPHLAVTWLGGSTTNTESYPGIIPESCTKPNKILIYLIIKVNF